MRIAICTGGGDAPGLNAVIRASVLAGLERDFEMLGIERGFNGLLGDGRLLPLGCDEVRGIAHRGGTILGTTNKGNPFRFPVESDDGRDEEHDVSHRLLEAFSEERLDGLISIGGDGSMAIALELFRKGLPVIGVPKTIDNDVGGTTRSFGFTTAVAIATEALDRLHSTAESHERVMVVEVMGRNAGWIALHSGIAGSADVILIPEIPFSMDKVAAKIEARERAGRHFSIVVVAEGACPVGGRETWVKYAEPGQNARLGGAGKQVSESIAALCGKDTRDLVLGHLQRGGSPTAFDRLLALRFGAAAVRAAADGAFGTMVAYHPPTISRVSLERVCADPHRVSLDSDIVETARDLSICLGD
jgi:phosphofructokinase-like protein